MPNPIPQDARVSKWRSSVDAIDHCPKLAAQICKIFAGWADLERRLDYLFLEVSGGSSRAGIAVFDAIDSRRLRAQVVTSAAEASLRDTNQMAVGYHEDFPECLALIPPDLFNDLYNNTRVMLSELGQKSAMRNLKVWKAPEPDFSKILLYNTDDFSRILDEISDVANVMSRLTVVLMYDHHPGPIPAGTAFSVRRQLLKSSRFRMALRHSREQDRGRRNARRKNPK